MAGHAVWWVHPWCLGPLPAALPANTLVIGGCLADFHRAWPWSARRRHFVGQRMAELAPRCWYADATAVHAAWVGARSVRCRADPHLDPWLPR